MSRRRTVAVAACALSLALPGVTSCTSSAAKPPSEVVAELGDVTDLTGQTSVTIEVIDNSYKPRVAKVVPGTKVTFKNMGANPHNVTPFEDGSFPVLTLTPGQSAEITVPQKVGDVPFYCTIHGGKSSGQRGALIIAKPF